MIRINIADGGVVSGLTRLIKHLDNPRPALTSIGQRLVDSTKQRFAQGKAPDGTTWAPNQPSTIEHHLRQRSGVFHKLSGKRIGTKKGYGRGGKKAAAVVAAKKPLHGLTGLLADQISSRVLPDGVEIGSSMVYSAMQQFGGTKAQHPPALGRHSGSTFSGVIGLG